MKLLALLLVFALIAHIRSRIVNIRGNQPYALSLDEAKQRCSELGGSLANKNDLSRALNQDRFLPICSCGWLADESARYVAKQFVPGCGNKNGIQTCTWKSKWNAFCYLGGPVENCSRPLGMENGQIPKRSITASSVRNKHFREWRPDLARLNKRGFVNAWSPAHDGRNQYIEVDLGRLTAISGIITQGAKSLWRKLYVTQFKIRYSKNGDRWNWMTENEREKIFDGNSDNNGHVRNMFPKIIVAQFIRFYPFNWRKRITLRFELLGCTVSEYDGAQDRDRGLLPPFEP